MKRFDLIHATHLHPPYGMWIVRHRGVEIGRQLSQPSQDDCERMLIKHREGPKPLQHADTRLSRTVHHVGGSVITRDNQVRGGLNKRKHARPGRPRKYG